MNIHDALIKAGNDKLAYMIGIRKKAIQACCDAIIDGTPVRTGALRGSWRSSEGSPLFDSTPRIDPSGAEPKEELSDVLQKITSEDVCFTNSLPYSESIEFDGHSQKAPEGMVRKNLVRWPGLVAAFSSGRTDV